MSGRNLARLIVLDIKKVAHELGRIPSQAEYINCGGKYTAHQISLHLGNWITALKAVGEKRSPKEEAEEPREPKVLFFDIETSLMEVFTFGIWEQTIPPEDIKKDWRLMSWAAKWKGKKEVLYMGNMPEKKMLKGIWELLNEADVVITQNGKAFDEKRLKARFIINKIPPYSPFEHVDTKVLAKKFGFSSCSLWYLAEALDCEHKKLEHAKFPGKKLWKECDKGNLEAWAEMKKYNIQDVLCLEEVYEKLRSWGDPISLNPYYGDSVYRCNCGSSNLIKNGHRITKTGKFQRFQCQSCGAWHQSSGAKNNLFSDKKKASLKRP